MESQEQLEQNAKDVSRFDFRGGLSLNRRPGVYQFILGTNLLCQPDGTLLVRNGHASIYAPGNDTGSIVSVLGYYSLATGELVYSIKREGAVDYLFCGNTEITGPSLSNGIWTSIKAYKNTIFTSNGIQPIQCHVLGTTTRASITGSLPPAGQFLYFYKDRAYTAKHGSNILNWSNAGFFGALPATNWSGDNAISLGNNGDSASGICGASDYFYFFTEDSYHVMSGTPGDNGSTGDMAWKEFPGFGTRSPLSITRNNKGMVFLGSNRKPYMIDGVLAETIDPNNLVSEVFNGIPDSALGLVATEWYQDRIFFYIPAGSLYLEKSFLVFDNNTGSWFNLSGYGYSLNRNQSTNNLIIGSSNDRNIYRYDTGIDDNGSKISLDWRSRWEPLGSFKHKKVIHSISIQVEVIPGDTINFQYAIDGSEEFTNFGSGNPVSAETSLWGADKWGVSKWSSKKLFTIILRFLNGADINAYELCIRAYGSVASRTRILSYSIDADTYMTEE